DGADDAEIAEGEPRLGLHHASERGIAGRGVLLDMPRYYADRGEEMARTQAFTPDVLEAAAAHQGVTFRTGDILLLHTGWAEDYRSRAPGERRRGSAGLHQSQDMLEWLWNRQFSLVAADNPGLEAFPLGPDSGFFFAGEGAPERGPSHNGM